MIPTIVDIIPIKWMHKSLNIRATVFAGKINSYISYHFSCGSNVVKVATNDVISILSKDYTPTMQEELYGE